MGNTLKRSMALLLIVATVFTTVSPALADADLLSETARFQEAESGTDAAVWKESEDQDSDTVSENKITEETEQKTTEENTEDTEEENREQTDYEKENTDETQTGHEIEKQDDDENSESVSDAPDSVSGNAAKEDYTVDRAEGSVSGRLFGQDFRTGFRKPDGVCGRHLPAGGGEAGACGF